MPLILPTEIRFSNAGQTAVTPMLWYAGRIDEISARNQSTLEGSAQQLGMFFQFSVPFPPGGGS
jgi:hypothetical protein